MTMYGKLLSVVVLFGLTACGGGGGGGGSTTPTAATPTPEAAVTASGAGALVVHPSLDPTYAVALETPVRIQETAGGEADWNYARFTLIKGGREVERGEVGSDVIRRQGYGRIKPRSNEVYTIVFRFNSDDFDSLRITLGLADINTARQFQAEVSPGSFTDVNVSFTPLKRQVDPTPL